MCRWRRPREAYETPGLVVGQKSERSEQLHSTVETVLTTQFDVVQSAMSDITYMYLVLAI